MEANLNNDFKYDKIIINLDSLQGIHSNTNNFGCYFKFNDTIKNAVAIQVIDTIVISEQSAQYNPYEDCFFVILNNIERATTYNQYINIYSNPDFNIHKYFEKVEYTDNSISNSRNISVSHIGTSTGSFSDSGTYMFNPVIPTLDRFELTLKDKDFKDILNTKIFSVKLSICIYTLKKSFG